MKHKNNQDTALWKEYIHKSQIKQKNFEVYIDTIAHMLSIVNMLVEGNINHKCIVLEYLPPDAIPLIKCTKPDCFHCFKKWALTDASS